MKNFPKHLNSKADYEYIRKYFPREQWEPKWRALLENTKQWFFTHELPSEEAGITDATHKIVVSQPQQEGEATKYLQYELRDDPSCDLYRLGFTADYVTRVLEEANE